MGARSSQSRGPGLNKTDGHLLEYFRQTFGSGGGGTNPPPPPPEEGLTATGGVINEYTSGPIVYRAHVFTSSGTFDVSAIGDFPAEIEYLVVAGGGGGAGSGPGGWGAGGGGAGGFRTNVTGHPLAGSSFTVSTSPGSYPITVGGGGGGNAGPAGPGTKGSNSVLTSPNSPETISSEGGGGGVRSDPAPADVNGGSGGGGFNQYDGGTGNSPPVSPSQGFPGGGGPTPDNSGGGGGGATGAGGAGTTPEGGAGGTGSNVGIVGFTTHYAVGGGGASLSGGSPTDPHGIGGTGGDGIDSTSGHFNTGSGGGGRRGDILSAGSGGSGIVVVRYKIGEISGTAKATGGLISYYNNKVIHTFTSSGTFTSTGGNITDCEYILIGGGGGGGAGHQNGVGGGGGGAGQYLAFGPVTIPAPAKPVIVGAGGKAWAVGESASQPAPEYNLRGGYPTTFNSQVAGGGGAGGTSGAGYPGNPPYTGFDGKAGTPGGSGSGGGKDGFDNGPAGAGNGSSPGGNPGADGPTNTSNAGHGGGGAGGAGSDGTTPSSPQKGGDGGAGVQLPTTFRDPSQTFGLGPGSPSPYHWVAGGGAGGVHAPPNNHGNRQGAGGDGVVGTAANPNAPEDNSSLATPYAGGGNGGHGRGDNTARNGNFGLDNTGGGGGGGGTAVPAGADGGHGGSGVVLIAYPTS